MRNWIFMISILFLNPSLGYFSQTSDSSKNITKILQSKNYCSINSTHLPLSFFNRLHVGGKIEEKDKGSVQNLNRINTTGFELDFSLGVKSINHTKNTGWYIDIQHLNTGGAKYSQSLFNLIFVGNKNITEPIDLEQTSFHFRSHQILHFGVIKNQFTMGISLGNISNEYQGKFNSEDQIKFSSPFLWEININPEILVLENNSNFFRKNGNSFGLDFNYTNQPLNLKDKKITFNVGFNNLGIMHFHNNLQKLEIDTSFNFEGLTIDQIINFDTTVSNFRKNIEPEIVSENEIQLSPFTLFGELIYKINLINIKAGLFYRHSSQYIPKYYISIEKPIKKKILIGSNISYGGYNKFQWGANFGYGNEKIIFGVHLNNLIGFVPNYGKSFGLNLNFKWVLN